MSPVVIVVLLTLLLGIQPVATDLYLPALPTLQHELGAGIAPAQLTELFQPFKRLARTADVPGTGLGLVVVKLLLEQMRGGIEVASEPGHGARFTVWLRKVAVDAPAEARAN